MKNLKRQCPEFREREAQVKNLKRQCPEFREREAQAKVLKRQCPEVRKEKHVCDVRMPVVFVIIRIPPLFAYFWLCHPYFKAIGSRVHGWPEPPHFFGR